LIQCVQTAIAVIQSSVFSEHT